MGERLSPVTPRLLRWILPAEFVRRVAEPAYNDLLVSGIERGQSAVGLLVTARFVAECVWAAFPGTIFRLRRSKILAAVLATTVVALVIVRERMAYGAGYRSQAPSAKSERADRSSTRASSY
jgi:hypothetical protein